MAHRKACAGRVSSFRKHQPLGLIETQTAMTPRGLSCGSLLKMPVKDGCAHIDIRAGIDAQKLIKLPRTHEWPMAWAV